MKALAGLLCVCVAMLLLSAAVGHKGQASEQGYEPAPRPAQGQRTPVVVELFTSEGCSSCPPADALLARLDKMQPVPGAEVIALKQHVDYWNHLGWRDPYSSEQFSARQEGYARAFGNNGLYTPQMIVDGQTEFVGSEESRARQAIAQAARSPKAAVHLAWASNPEAGNAVPLEVHVEKFEGAMAGDTAEVFLAVTESNLHSEISSGENAGRKLDHTAVVRTLERIGIADPQAAAFAARRIIEISPGWKRENLRAVVFVQGIRRRRMLAAASTPFSQQ